MKKWLSVFFIIFIFNIVVSYAEEPVFLINNDEDITRSTNVVLNINYTGAVRMRFANDRMANWSDWEAFSSEKSWELTAGDGRKTVYIEIENRSGETSVYSDTILFEKYPRGTITLRWEYVQASVGGYAIYLWDGYAYREIDRVPQEILEWNSDEARIYPTEETLARYDDNSVTESLFTAKGRGERLRNNPNGLYRVMQDGMAHSYDEYKDNYLFKIGTINEYGEVALSATITTRMENWYEASNMSPEVSIVINNGESATRDRNVELTITASDDTTRAEDLMMRFSNDNRNNFGEWEEFKSTKSWELSEGIGQKVVFVEIKDNDGSITIASATITLEKIIEFEVVTLNGAHATKNNYVTLQINGIDNIKDYNCLYVIDNVETSIEIEEGNKIILPLEKQNKNNFKIKLISRDETEIGEKDIEIWKL